MLQVAIKDKDGKITIGQVDASIDQLGVGEITTVKLHDENGNKIEKSGTVVEIF